MQESKDRKYKKRILLALAGFLAIFISLFSAYDFSIKNTGFSPNQPVAFSHKKHSGEFGIKCLYCHFSAEKSAFSNIPTTKACIVCHVALKNTSELVKPLNISIDTNSRITYTRVYRVPDYTHFNHSVHIRAMIDCSSCHGSVEFMDSVRQVSVLSMSWCLNCHREPEKYVQKPKLISGIIIDENSMTKDSYLPSVMPEYGMWINKNNKSPVMGFYIPHKYGRGSESCSSCHY